MFWFGMLTAFIIVVLLFLAFSVGVAFEQAQEKKRRGGD
jgi:hypothetical protein